MAENREQLSDRLTRWTILTCPDCGGLVEQAITTHLGDCPRRFTMFVAREVEVVQADCEYSAMVAYHQERYARLRAENEALKADRDATELAAAVGHEPLTCELCHAEGVGAELGRLRAEHERLREALRPFVQAYNDVNRTFCPDFRGRMALGWFDDAAAAFDEEKAS